MRHPETVAVIVIIIIITHTMAESSLRLLDSAPTTDRALHLLVSYRLSPSARRSSRVAIFRFQKLANQSLLQRCQSLRVGSFDSRNSKFQFVNQVNPVWVIVSRSLVGTQDFRETQTTGFLAETRRVEKENRKRTSEGKGRRVRGKRVPPPPPMFGHFLLSREIPILYSHRCSAVWETCIGEFGPGEKLSG